MRTRNISEAGSALVLATLVVFAVMAAALAFLGESVLRSRSELSERRLDDGLRLCDAALEQARRYLQVYRDSGSWRWDDILAYNVEFPIEPLAVRARYDALKAARGLPDGLGQVPAATWPEAPTPGDPVNPDDVATVFGVFTSFFDGAWFMAVRNNPEEADPLHDTDDVLMVYIDAVLRDGSQRHVEARVRYEPPFFTPQGAVITGGTLKIAGNPSITAEAGTPAADVLSNSDLVINGSPAIEGAAYAAAGVSVSGSPAVRDGFVSGAPPVRLPTIDLADLRSRSTHFFSGSGQVTDAAGAVLAVGNWYNWRFQSGEWQAQSGASSPRGVYYFYTSVQVGAQAEVEATLISEGSVVIDGGSRSRGATIAAAEMATAIVAVGDVKITGNAAVTGFIIAGEQVHFSGNVSIASGGVIALDEADYSRVVSSTTQFDDLITGTVDIAYEGGQATLLRMPRYSLELVRGRRVR